MVAQTQFQDATVAQDTNASTVTHTEHSNDTDVHADNREALSLSTLWQGFTSVVSGARDKLQSELMSLAGLDHFDELARSIDIHFARSGEEREPKTPKRTKPSDDRITLNVVPEIPSEPSHLGVVFKTQQGYSQAIYLDLMRDTTRQAPASLKQLLGNIDGSQGIRLSLHAADEVPFTAPHRQDQVLKNVTPMEILAALVALVVLIIQSLPQQKKHQVEAQSRAELSLEDDSSHVNVEEDSTASQHEDGSVKTKSESDVNESFSEAPAPRIEKEEVLSQAVRDQLSYLLALYQRVSNGLTEGKLTHQDARSQIHAALASLQRYLPVSEDRDLINRSILVQVLRDASQSTNHIVLADQQKAQVASWLETPQGRVIQRIQHHHAQLAENKAVSQKIVNTMYDASIEELTNAKAQLTQFITDMADWVYVSEADAAERLNAGQKAHRLAGEAQDPNQLTTKFEFGVGRGLVSEVRALMKQVTEILNRIQASIFAASATADDSNQTDVQNSGTTYCPAIGAGEEPNTRSTTPTHQHQVPSAQPENPRLDDGNEVHESRGIASEEENDEQQTPQKVEAGIKAVMEAAISGARWSGGFSCTPKSQELQAQLARYSFARENADDVEAANAIKAFVAIAIVPRNPVYILPFFKAESGHTKSATAFFNALTDVDVRATVANVLGTPGLPEPDGLNQGVFAAAANNAGLNANAFTPA